MLEIRQRSEATYLVRLSLIALAGLLLREWYTSVENNVRVFTDEFWFITQARRLTAGHPWTNLFDYANPSAAHGPVTSLFMAPFAWIFPHATAGLRYVIPLIGILSVFGVASALRTVSSERTALIGAGLAAIYPGLWVRDGLVVSEPFAIAGLVWLLALCLRWRENLTGRRSLALGLLVGVVALSRAELSLLGVLLVAVTFLTSPSHRRYLRFATVLVAAVGVCLPWTLYNSTRFDRPVYLTTNFGVTLAGANCEPTYFDSRFVGYDSEACWNAAMSRTTSTDESIQSQEMAHEALSYATSHVSRWPVVVAAREAWFLGLRHPGWVVHMSGQSGQRAFATWAQAWSEWILIPLAILAWFQRRKQASEGERLLRRLALLAVVFSVGLAAMFVGHWRYRLGMDVSLLMLVALWLGSETFASRA